MPAEPATRSPDAVPSFDQVFGAYFPYVWRALRRLGVPAADADDVCQDVFVIVHRKLPEFEGRSSLRTWLFAIALRVASDYRKSARVRRERVTPEPPERDFEATQDAELERKRVLARIDRALTSVDIGPREVFVLFELEKMSMTEVAETVGCPLKTAYSRLYAARKQFERELRRLTPVAVEG